MGIDDIKGPGPFLPPGDPQPEMPVAPSRESGFAEVRDAVADGNDKLRAPQARAAGLGIAHLDRAVLDDPQKLDAAVRTVASELVNSGQNVSGSLSGAEKEMLVDFACGDPLFRQHIESYLRKVLV